MAPRWCPKCHSFLMPLKNMEVNGEHPLRCSGRGCKVLMMPRPLPAPPEPLKPPASAEQGPRGTCATCKAEDVPVRAETCWPCTLKAAAAQPEVP